MTTTTGQDLVAIMRRWRRASWPDLPIIYERADKPTIYYDYEYDRTTLVRHQMVTMPLCIPAVQNVINAQATECKLYGDFFTHQSVDLECYQLRILYDWTLVDLELVWLGTVVRPHRQE